MILNGCIQTDEDQPASHPNTAILKEHKYQHIWTSTKYQYPDKHLFTSNTQDAPVITPPWLDKHTMAKWLTSLHAITANLRYQVLFIQTRSHHSILSSAVCKYLCISDVNLQAFYIYICITDSHCRLLSCWLVFIVRGYFLCTIQNMFTQLDFKR